MVKNITEKNLQRKNNWVHNLRKYSKQKQSLPIAVVVQDAFKAENVHVFYCFTGDGVMLGSWYWPSSAPTKQRLLGERHISPLSGFLQIEIGASFRHRILALKFCPCQKYPLNDFLSWFWLQLPTEMLRLCLPQIIYFLHFILLMSWNFCLWWTERKSLSTCWWSTRIGLALVILSWRNLFQHFCLHPQGNIYNKLIALNSTAHS